MKNQEKQQRVIMTRPIVGIAGMQVCAVKDATDKEILEFCNKVNPSGTKNGWCEVTRDDKESPQNNPVQCKDDKDRLHFLVYC